MNIQVQICGIVVVVLLLIMSINRKTIWLRTKRAFLRSLLSTLIMLVFDVLSIATIVNAGGEYGLFTRTICKIYLISLVWMAYSMNQYTTIDIGIKNSYIAIFMNLFRLFLIISNIMIIILPINFHYTNRFDLYTYGPAVVATYIGALMYTFINIIMLIIFRNKMNRRRWRAGINWMLLIISASIIQFFNSSILIIGFACAIGTLIVFIRLENPESFIERETGCFNDLAFNAYLEQCYSRGELISMLIIQFSNPHYLYERYNNDSVNDFLKQFSKLLEGCTQGTLFKYREWEYVVIFPRDTRLDSALEEIHETLDKTWYIEDDRANIDLVYTAVPSSFIARDAESMLEMMRAFRRDYSNSKEKNLFMGEEWANNYRKEQEIEDMIISAINDDRILVYYQPIYSTEKKKFVSAEALVRIIDEDGNIIPPGAFIPVAEDTGLILQIGKIVFTKACRFMKEHCLYEKGIEYLEINLSAVQCARTDLADVFIKIIKDAGIDPHRINLEITESMAITSTEVLIKNMEQMRRIGVSFSLDDFGTGFSNLDYLLELPIKIVKFDRKMTQAYFENAKRHSMMDGAINMIKAADLEIVAEGVEDKHQLDALSKVDIDFIQGFYFSKPVPPEEFLKLISNQTAD